MDTRDQVFRFGPYESRPRSRELYKHGLKVKVRPQPLQVLNLLLSLAGDVVSREALRDQLWSSETFVDFEHSLNTAVKEIRAALNDSAVEPRYIETLPRLGYRFIAPVEVIAPTGDLVSSQRLNAAAPVIEAPHSTRRSLYLWVCATLVVAAAALGGSAYHRRAHFKITPQDTVVIADFENTTGDEVFNTSLKRGLRVGLEQSPMVRVLAEDRAVATMEQTGRPAGQPMTGPVAIEVCQRTGGKIIVQGSISKLGDAYLIALKAIRCDNRESVADEQAEARQKEEVVESLGKAASQLRSRLGESLPSIRAYDSSLEQATTPSLEALRAYGLALAKTEKSSALEAIPLLDRAIELDPNFALAYGELATLYWDSDETELSRQNASRAYELRNRTTEIERLWIESWYSIYVKGDLEKAAATLETMRQIYPGESRPLNDLGTLYGNLGLYDKAVDRFHDSLRTDPASATTAGNLATSLMALGRNDEARSVLDGAAKTGPPTDYLFQVNYWSAFLRRDANEMNRLFSVSDAVPGARSIWLSTQANSEAYSGHFGKARRLTLEAASQMQIDGQKDAAGLCLAQMAIWELEVQDFARAQFFVSKALKLSHEQNVILLSAVVTADAGEYPKSVSTVEHLAAERPSDTFVQKYWLPIIRAESDLHQRKASQAVDSLISVLPLDRAAPEALDICALFPAYVRGQAYLAAAEGDKAAEQFQMIIDHPGIILNCPLGSLAWLGIARAHRASKQDTTAIEDYEAFFTLWKNADPDIPVLNRAKLEYATLRRQ